MALYKRELIPDSFEDGMPVYHLKARPIRPHESYAGNPLKASSRYDAPARRPTNAAMNPYRR